MGRAYYIIGTDTACGKTVVTAAIAAWLRSQKRDVGVMKPFESASQDSVFLKEMSGSSDPLSEINPYHFEEPLAPAVAAERAGIVPSFERVRELFHQLSKRHEILLLEGAGGLLVPLVGTETHVELLKLLAVPVLLVARLGLGTLNHTLLTLKVMQQEGIACAGVILNEVAPRSSVAEATNADVLKRLAVPVLGIFAHVRDPKNASDLQKAVPTALSPLFA